MQIFVGGFFLLLSLFRHRVELRKILLHVHAIGSSACICTGETIARAVFFVPSTDAKLRTPSFVTIFRTQWCRTTSKWTREKMKWQIELNKIERKSVEVGDCDGGGERTTFIPLNSYMHVKSIRRKWKKRFGRFYNSFRLSTCICRAFNEFAVNFMRTLKSMNIYSNRREECIRLRGKGDGRRGRRKNWKCAMGIYCV